MTGIIFNPSARGDKARSFLRQLQELEGDVQLAPTQGPGDARALGRKLIEGGCRTIVAAGGDGTVNEVLNGLVDAPDGLAQARLAVLPLGTVNVFAKEMGIPGDFRSAWKVIQAGREKRIDLPSAEFINAAGQTERRSFILLAGTGLSARAIEKVDWSCKKRWGPLAYLWAGVQAMREPPTEVTLSLPGETFTSPLVEVGNGEFFGGRFVLFPQALLDDAQFDVTLLKHLSWAVLLRVFFRLLTRRLSTSPDVILRQTPTLGLSSALPLSLHLDGDVVGRLPASLAIQSRALRVVVP